LAWFSDYHTNLHQEGTPNALDAATGELLSADAFTEVNWADGVDVETGRPIMRPEARYDVTGKPFNAIPGPQGAHSWHPMAYSPQTNYVYIPVLVLSMHGSLFLRSMLF
jgi:hypothetical protein